ncbi:MAG: hypothetical protein JNL54_17925 [Kineosporiaceae bacterium]|nr:hypothetical protein [Kineosporiaceae bacterium]MBL8932002.1 hypothetical protein [Kineosporiaceae bacterium]
MSLTDRYVIWRAERTLRRSARTERERLRREMAAYSTPAHRADLLATFDRYPDEVTARYRAELSRQTVSTLGKRNRFGTRPHHLR